jgi:hypothetical protein
VAVARKSLNDCNTLTPPPCYGHGRSQDALNALEDGTRAISPAWKVWGSAEEGGAAKPSAVLR